MALLELPRGPDGKRKRRKAIRATRREAAAALRQMEAEREHGLAPEVEAWTLEHWLKLWVEDAEVKPATRTTYRISIRRVCARIGHVKLRKLNASDIRAYLKASEAEDGLAAQTRRNDFRTLARGLEVAYRYGHIPTNPARAVAAPVVRREEPTVLTPEQTRELLAAASSDPLEALYVVAATTGMRKAELRGLTWEKVDLKAETIRVDHALARYRDAPETAPTFHLSTPKTRKSHRTIWLTPPAVEALKAHRRQQVEERLGALAWLNEWDLVFTTPGECGRPIDDRDLHDAWKALLKRAKLPDTKFHALRHGAATLLWEAGADLKMIQETLGHADIGITANIYTHFSDDMRKSVAEKMNAALFEENDGKAVNQQ